MRVFVTGGSGVIGRAGIPLLRAAGHDVVALAHAELDLFDAEAVARAVDRAGAVVHLATRIRVGAPRERWRENDRLRTEASRLLVDAALAGGAEAFVQAGVTFVGPPTPPILESMLVAEAETARFAASGGRGIVLRFGLLDGPGTGNDEPNPHYGSTLHGADAGAALVTALAELGSGVYRVDREHTGSRPGSPGQV